MKIFSWIRENALFIATLFLLAFIPLYPKLPLIDIKNTWVYIRVEDFLLIFVLFLWMLFLIRKKITLKTPLTMPILLFWIVGAIATIHGVILIFPTLATVFPNVALLSYIRRIEYLSVFFIAFAGMRDKRFLTYVIIVLVATLLAVVGYGFGQKYLGFPAFLTMNEEFAKGEAIRLSALSRVPSTFAGHYDLAAYLVLIIPILASLIFGIRNWIVRGILFASVALGFALLFMTVSRVSFAVLIVALALVLFFQKKKIAVLTVALLAFLVPILIVQFTPALFARFGDTVKEVDVLVDAANGEVIGHTSIVPQSHFNEKLVLRRVFQAASGVESQARLKENELTEGGEDVLLPFHYIPKNAVLIVPPNAPTGENLPQGTAYINLPLSPVVKRVGQFFYEDTARVQTASNSAVSYVFTGNFLIKRASAYDLSFTTRFQGEWPNALLAFKRNILLGSGYGSVSLAVDNNYLRILGEVGLLGFVAFLTIFIAAGLYVRKILPDIDSSVTKSFVLGFAAGVVGLMLNGLLIDVFEASKVAFVLWLLMGVTIGAVSLYQQKHFSMRHQLFDAATSTYAIIVYLLTLTIVIYAPMISNYFVADDYTWLRWAADCRFDSAGAEQCSSPLRMISHYFADANGFFYRPGTKIYFFMMYPVFWLNQTIYHVVSLLLHFATASLVFLLAMKVFRNKLHAAFMAITFLLMSGYVEIVFWISATGHLFNAFFIFLSLWLFILWDEKKKTVFFVLSMLSLVISLLFYELGVVVPLLIILYKLMNGSGASFKKILKTPHFLLPFLPVIFYLGIRFLAQSHWTGGDYSYNLIKLPLNAVGNIIGYLLLIVFGPITLPISQALRTGAKEHLVLSFIILVVMCILSFLLYRSRRLSLAKDDRRVVLFGILFFVISLLPFLGFGNIASRYSYVASFGILVLFVFVLQKIYSFLKSNGRDIALGSIGTVLSVFLLIHVIQVQQIHGDWRDTGGKTKQFFISIDKYYDDYWSTKPMELYFSNVPVKVGQAWVFPVGITDALWFAFQNPKMRIHAFPTRLDAIQAAGELSKTKKVFEFNDSGEITERFGLQEEQ